MKYTLFLIFTFALLAACTSTPVVTKKREDPNSFPAWQARHKQEVEQFLQYLAAQDVLKVLRPEHLLRSASDWEKCNAEPFAVPPRQRWSDAVSVLRLLRYLQLTGVIGSVEVYSAYRNPSLNICAGGAKSAHARSFAFDFVCKARSILRMRCVIFGAHKAPCGIWGTPATPPVAFILIRRAIAHGELTQSVVRSLAGVFDQIFDNLPCKVRAFR